jgi:hypothetical protein
MRTATLSLLASLTFTLAALGVGCGSTVTGGDDEDGGTDCPDHFAGDCQHGPADCIDGEWVCPDGGCDQGVAVDCEEGEAYCLNGTWTCPGTGCDQGVAVDCLTGSAQCIAGEWVCPEDPVCPETAPFAGDPCPAEAEGLACEYDAEMDCGPSRITMECEGGTWQYGSVPRCSPVYCSDYNGDPDLCASSGCRWLEPGCGDLPLNQAGCFDMVDCAPDSCMMSNEQCLTVSIDPCAGERCGACSQEVTVCVPQLVGE